MQLGRRISSSIIAVGALFASVLAMVSEAPPAAAVSTSVVISQVYGGGGNLNATYSHDFVELHNLSASTVSLMGWSVQYASVTGTTWSVNNLSGTIVAGGYRLVQLATNNASTGMALPTPDITGTSNMAGAEGKVALL